MPLPVRNAFLDRMDNVDAIRDDRNPVLLPLRTSRVPIQKKRK